MTVLFNTHWSDLVGLEEIVNVTYSFLQVQRKRFEKHLKLEHPQTIFVEPLVSGEFRFFTSNPFLNHLCRKLLV